MKRPLLLVLSFYALLCWAYVVALQITDTSSVYWELAWWLPWVRMDYFGESAFVMSFVFAVMWVLSSEEPKRR
jgi:hypothetical protein